jgi:hypothetical protein
MNIRFLAPCTSEVTAVAQVTDILLGSMKTDSEAE